jgi:hypothetical protein
MIQWDYDIALEQNVAGNSEFAERVQKARARAEQAGILDVPLTVRHMMTGATLIASGFSSDEAAEMTYLARLTPAQRTIAEG